MIFYSKIDLWMHIVFIGTTLVIISLPYLYYKTTKDVSLIQSLLVTLLPMLFSLLMLLPCYLNTYYQVDDHQLLVKSGLFSWKIPLSEIESIEPTHSFLSAPALSLDRLVIHYGDGKRVVVSPKDNQGFIEAVGRSEVDEEEL